MTGHVVLRFRACLERAGLCHKAVLQCSRKIFLALWRSRDASYVSCVSLGPKRQADHKVDISLFNAGKLFDRQRLAPTMQPKPQSTANIEQQIVNFAILRLPHSRLTL